MINELLILMGRIIGTLTEFFSMIAPGYLILIIVVFMAMMPYVLFKLMQKMVVSHA